MGFGIEAQAANVTPPRRGAVIALTVDSTARAYSLVSLDIGGIVPEGALNLRHPIWLTLQAETADVFFLFSDGSDTNLDDTAAVSAGSSLAYADTYGARLVADQSMEFRIDRAKDTHLIVKAASTSGILRLWASSHAQ